MKTLPLLVFVIALAAVSINKKNLLKFLKICDLVVKLSQWLNLVSSINVLIKDFKEHWGGGGAVVKLIPYYGKHVRLVWVLTYVVLLLLQSQNPDPHVTVRPSGSVTTGGICSHQSDCADELCCVHTGLTGKRRKRLFFDGLFDHHGVCQPYRALVRWYRQAPDL
mgnify:CR=1 FL=1